MEQLLTSPDGQWIAHRRGRAVVLWPGGGGAPVGRAELPSDDVDLAFVGPPASLVAVVRDPDVGHRVLLLQPPFLDAVARHDLDGPLRLIATTGSRLVLLSADALRVTVVRVAARALAAQPLEPGGPVEVAAGLERNQVLLALAKKLEVWDAVSSRPLLRLQLQLPPAPRSVGSALGHLWATRPGSDEVYVYRLSDGRPFRHYVGAAVRDVISNPASPLLVIATPRGLVRLHCFAHSLHVVESPWAPPAANAEASPLALLAVGEDVALVGVPPPGEPASGEPSEGDEPWRLALAGTHAPPPTPDGEPAEIAGEPAGASVADKMRAMRGGQAASATSAPASPPPDFGAGPSPRQKAWRDPLAVYGAELARGVESELPLVAVDTELGELAHRLGLSGPARRALAALYSLHLVGEPELSIARLARALGEWGEALGQGDLVAHALVRRDAGRLRLRSAVCAWFDGAPAEAIRVLGSGAGQAPPGAWRLARAGRSDAELETALATQLGRVAVFDQRPARALLEARLCGAVAVTVAPPRALPAPWPRDATLVVVTDGDGGPAWTRALPPLTSS